MPPMSFIDLAQLKERLGPLAGRFDVDALDECDSTNSELLRRAAGGAPSGSTVVAQRQLAGRGRRGRNWISQPQDSLTFSLLWRLPPGQPPSGLSLAVGLALLEALQAQGAQHLALKWPNDLLYLRAGESAKLAGILIELSSDARGMLACIGIGLNLRAPSGDFASPVAGLDEILPLLPPVHALLASILRALAQRLDTFTQAGFAPLQADWMRHHAWQDSPVNLLADGALEISGLCRGVDADGALLLETGEGLQRILAGDLSLRRA